jgi:hypothetical protein
MKAKNGNKKSNVKKPLGRRRKPHNPSTETTLSHSTPAIGPELDNRKAVAGDSSKWKQNTTARKLGAVLLTAIDEGSGCGEEGHLFPNLGTVIRVVPMGVLPAEVELGLAFLEELGLVGRWLCCGKEVYGRRLY